MAQHPHFDIKGMANSLFVRATRALVKVIITLARAYQVAVTVTRDSPEPDILRAYKQVVRKAHPDKGGRGTDFHALHDAKEKWDALRQTKASRPAGRRWPNAGASGALMVLAVAAGCPEEMYRIRGCSVLLTYHGFKRLSDWQQFLQFVRHSLSTWGVLHWCATLEKSGRGKLHTHLVLQFRKPVDRSPHYFAFVARVPNASSNDLVGDGLCKKKFQYSVNRSFFYVWADKEGTQRNSDGTPCVEGDHQPVWTDAISRYQVFAKWCENLWRQRKLSHARYEEYLFLTRDGVISRKRNLEAVKEKECHDGEATERAIVTKRVKSGFAKFGPVLEAQEWLALFTQELDRYPILVVLGPSRSRKTEWAKSLFTKPLALDVGVLEHIPDDMREFDRKVHDAIILDDVRDMNFLVHHQEKIQGKIDRVVVFAETPSGGYKYRRWLWRVPIVVTANFTTKNLDLLDTDDYLGHPENRYVVRRQRQP